MRRVTHSLSLLLGLLCTSSVASAVPVDVTITLYSGVQGSFHYSFLHSAETNCETIGGVGFCKNGSTVLPVAGVLTAKQEGLVLSDIAGTLFVDGVGGGDDIVVTDGFVDFAGSAPDTFGAELVTSTHGTFYFLDHTFSGPANGFDGSTLYLWGNNWNTGTKNTHADPDWGLDIGAWVVAEPPAAALWLAGCIGLFAVCRPRLEAYTRR